MTIYTGDNTSPILVGAGETVIVTETGLVDPNSFADGAIENAKSGSDPSVTIEGTVLAPDSTVSDGFRPVEAAGVYLDEGGTLNNTGTGFIEGGSGDSTNAAGGAGAHLKDVTFVNAGFVAGGNAGEYNGGFYGIAGDGVDLTGGSLNNTSTGIIIGGDGANGSGVGVSAVDALVVNAGTIIGGSGAGVTLDGSTLITSGEISRPTVGVSSAVEFLSGQPSDLVVENGAEFLGTIAGFATGDVVDITNLAPSAVAADFDSSKHILNTPSDGVLDFAGKFTSETFTFTSDGSGGTDISLEAACYVRGTHIATPRGPMSIEQLAIGNEVLTASGAIRPVVWLGHRRVNVAAHPSRADIAPIRVAANAFGSGAPSRDLWLSPGHNIAYNGSLMPISALQNGTTVQQVMLDAVEYWHVELDAHDIILAESLPAESYLDTGNRNHFANGGTFIEQHPDFQPRHWADTCLPLVFSGPAVVDAKMALRAQAELAGYVTTEESGMHLLADGLRIEPDRVSDQEFSFHLPADCQRIQLCSKTFVPTHVYPNSGDKRMLGICVARLQIDGVDVPLDDDAVFLTGWNGFEAHADGKRQRWTTGNAPLPANTRDIVIALAGRGRYWVERPAEPLAACA